MAGSYDYLKRTRLADPEVAEASAAEEAKETDGTEPNTITDDSMFEE